MSKGKKIALIVSMVAVLVVAAVLNVTLLSNKSNNPTNGDAVQTSFFTSSRLDRQTARDYEIAELNKIIAMEGDEYAEARQNALARKQQIIEAMETEMLIETLLKAQGFADVLVTVNTSMDNISVIVDKDELTQQDRVKIYNIIATEAAMEPDYIRILCV